MRDKNAKGDKQSRNPTAKLLRLFRFYLDYPTFLLYYSQFRVIGRPNLKPKPVVPRLSRVHHNPYFPARRRSAALKAF